jgi:hypothetical protein
MRQSEHVLYITLVDFLLQLLFLGLVLSVIHSALQPDPDEVQANNAFVAEIKKLTGISDLTVLTDELTRLGPLKSAANDVKFARELESLMTKVGGQEKALKLLNDEIKKAGQGLPSCMPNGKTIATFDAYVDRLELQSPVSPEMNDLLKTLKTSPDKVMKLPLNDFREIFGPVAGRNQTEKCIYNVVLVEHAFDTRPRDKFRGLFVPFTRAASDLR